MKRSNKLPLRLTAMMLCLVLLGGCAMKEGEPEANVTELPEKIQFAPKTEIGQQHLRDVDLLYQDDPFSVVTMYLTVQEGNATDNTNHTWEEVNTYSAYYYDELGIDRYKVAGILQVGDENGPLPGQLGYGVTLPNATVQIRGQTSSRNPQKNYKIKLNDYAGDWRGQKTIALNKHMGEGMRFRNKMAYDLISEVPQLMGLRTQFVHLYVRDKTGSDPDHFVDYGLYTQVEQLNKTALRAHGLDKNGYLYKINFFEFYLYDAIVPVADPDYDEKAFTQYLEPKGRQDHEKLIDMLNDVNDYALSSDELLDKYFDRENLAYWMAFMMLIGNSDVQSRNVYIYSPVNSDTWYFYAWDNDAVLMMEEEQIIGFSDFSDWEDGVTNYWCNQLFRRALLSSTFRAELDAAVEDLYAHYLQPERVDALAKKYAETVLPYVYSMPDIINAPLNREEYSDVLGSLADEIDHNYDRYKESLLSPMPFYVGLPELTDNETIFTWDSSLGFTNEEILYHIWLARDAEGNDRIMETDDLFFTRYSLPEQLEPGQYFLHVCAHNESGYTTNCFDLYAAEKGSIYGVYTFFVREDGTVEAYSITE